MSSAEICSSGGRCCKHGLLALIVTVAVLAGTRSAQARYTITFQHRDSHYLLPDQSEGGLVYVPDTVTDPTTPVPLVVFLHGMNPEHALHLWFGGGGYDLRDHFEQFAEVHDASFVVAAPSNTRHAGYYRNLWQGFDTAAFVKDTARALNGVAVIDENRVFVVGHSAAGCNLNGGLLTAAATAGPIHIRGHLPGPRRRPPNRGASSRYPTVGDMARCHLASRTRRLLRRGRSGGAAGRLVPYAEDQHGLESTSHRGGSSVAAAHAQTMGPGRPGADEPGPAAGFHARPGASEDRRRWPARLNRIEGLFTLTARA